MSKAIEALIKKYSKSLESAKGLLEMSLQEEDYKSAATTKAMISCYTQFLEDLYNPESIYNFKYYKDERQKTDS